MTESVGGGAMEDSGCVGGGDGGGGGGPESAFDFLASTPEIASQ